MAKKKDLVQEAWRRGILDFKLHPGQKKMDDVLKSYKTKIKTVLCARRFGKSFYLVKRAIEVCLRKSYAVVKYVCPKLKMVSIIIEPLIREIMLDCPKHLRPTFMKNDKVFIFPNGSQIQLAGTDNGSHENLRGGQADLCIVDEAGFCDQLGYVVFDILKPTTLLTDGEVILASTPSKTSDHDFIQKFVIPALGNNQLAKFTIHDNPLLTEAKIQETRDEFPGGDKDVGYRREYMCEIINDDKSVVIPDWTAEMKERCLRAVKRPPHFDIYVSCDVGFRDLTVALFGYYDFITGKIVIVDELVMNGPEMTTERLAFEIKKKEAKHFSDAITFEPIVPYMRFMDNNNLLLINDLARMHNISFIPTAKDDKEAAINKTRMMISAGRVIIDPDNCPTLDYHLSNAVWDKNRKTFKRIADTADHKVKGGHADALDALVYMVRNIVFSKNPYPSSWNMLKGDDVFYSNVNSHEDNKPEVQAVKTMANFGRFNNRKKRKLWE